MLAADAAALSLVEAELDKRWPSTKIEPSLWRIAALMDRIGAPQESFPSIHVAGTNGKTTVTRMIDALLTALDLRTGRTTSPHLQLVTERISIAGKPIAPRVFADTYRELLPDVEVIDGLSLAAGGPAMSQFEVLTAMAFAAFATASVDVGVIEVGLGGGWDATNVVDSRVAVITPIDIDHVDYLGDDLAGIAAEKAGIIKRSAPIGATAVIAEQQSVAGDVLLRRAVEADVTVAREGVDFALADRMAVDGGQLLTLRGICGAYDGVFLPLHGAHQAHNAAVALAAVEAFVGAGTPSQLDVDAVRQGFGSVRSPGRLECVGSAPAVVLDAAHNPSGARTLAGSLCTELPFGSVVGVVSMMRDKDVGGILAALEPVLDEVVVTTNDSPRAMEVADLYDLAVTVFGDQRVAAVASLPEALDTAVAAAKKLAGPARLVRAAVVVTGSVVTAGAARTLLGLEPA